MDVAGARGVLGTPDFAAASAPPPRPRFSRMPVFLPQRSIRQRSSVCRVSEKDQKAKIEESRKFQLEATEVMAEILKASDKEKRADELVDSLNEEFFYIASTYLSMAKKEANIEVVNQVEGALKAAMTAKDKTLRPEIRLFNKLLRDNSSAERQQTIQENHAYLHEDSYFFELLDRMMKDVEAHKDTPDRAKLVAQLQIIRKQTRDVAKMLKRASSSSKK